MKLKALASAFIAGTIFAAGLCLSGMTDARNVLAFLDVAGHWSPELAGVMVGAITVHAVWLRVSRRRAERVRQSTATPAIIASLAPRAPAGLGVNTSLVLGAALFGVGWGIAGYCPGPAIVSLGSGAIESFIFVLAMGLGMLLIELLRGPTTSPSLQRSDCAASAAE